VGVCPENRQHRREPGFLAALVHHAVNEGVRGRMLDTRGTVHAGGIPRIPGQVHRGAHGCARRRCSPGWRGALGGTGLALLVLLTLVILLGPALTRIPLDQMQLGLGTLLLMFGIRWLRKAVLRAARIIPLHDEEATYANETAALHAFGGLARGWDRVAVLDRLQDHDGRGYRGGLHRHRWSGRRVAVCCPRASARWRPWHWWSFLAFCCTGPWR